MDKLVDCRKKIDAIDKGIAKLLMLRLELVKEISDYKKINKIKLVDKKRESEVIKNIKKHSKANQKFVIGIFKNIIDYSKKIQSK